MALLVHVNKKDTTTHGGGGGGDSVLPQSLKSSDRLSISFRGWHRDVGKLTEPPSSMLDYKSKGKVIYIKLQTYSPEERKQHMAVAQFVISINNTLKCSIHAYFISDLYYFAPPATCTTLYRDPTRVIWQVVLLLQIERESITLTSRNISQICFKNDPSSYTFVGGRCNESSANIAYEICESILVVVNDS
ncbi:hypothetical protein R6Q59_004663 [Mikania micrantha]